MIQQLRDLIALPESQSPGPTAYMTADSYPVPEDPVSSSSAFMGTRQTYGVRHMCRQNTSTHKF